MKYGIYCIKDQLIGFMTPTLEKNDDVAKRNFKSSVNRMDHSGDYVVNDLALYCCGEFDVETGVITSRDPALVVLATSVIDHSIGGDVDV